MIPNSLLRWRRMTVLSASLFFSTHIPVLAQAPLPIMPLPAHAVQGSGSLAIDGGLSQNRYFAQFLADCSGSEVVVDGFAEKTAFGVAQLAAKACGNELEPISARIELYKPRQSDGLWKSRFENALARTRGWA